MWLDRLLGHPGHKESLTEGTEKPQQGLKPARGQGGQSKSGWRLLWSSF